MSKTHSFTTFRDWDPANTLEVGTPTFNLRRAPQAQVGDMVVINLVTLKDDRDGVYLGEVIEVESDFEVFTVELI